MSLLADQNGVAGAVFTRRPSVLQLLRTQGYHPVVLGIKDKNPATDESDSGFAVGAIFGDQNSGTTPAEVATKSLGCGYKTGSDLFCGVAGCADRGNQGDIAAAIFYRGSDGPAEGHQRQDLPGHGFDRIQHGKRATAVSILLQPHAIKDCVVSSSQSFPNRNGQLR